MDPIFSKIKKSTDPKKIGIIGSLGLRTPVFPGKTGTEVLEEKIAIGISRGLSPEQALLGAQQSVISDFFKSLGMVIEIPSPVVGRGFIPNVVGGEKFILDVSKFFYDIIGAVNAQRFKVTPTALATDEYSSSVYIPTGGSAYCLNFGWVVVGDRADRTLGSGQLTFGTKVKSLPSPTAMNIAAIHAAYALAAPKETLVTGLPSQENRFEVFIANTSPFWYREYVDGVITTTDSTTESVICGFAESAIKITGAGWNLTVYPVVPGHKQIMAWENFFAAGLPSPDTWTKFCLEIIDSVLHGRS